MLDHEPPFPTESEKETQGSESVHIGAKGDFGANAKAAEEHGDDALHTENLFDADADQFGEKTNLATGNKFDNSGDESAPAQLSVIEVTHEGNDVLPPLPKEPGDERADAFLAAHGELSEEQD